MDIHVIAATNRPQDQLVTEKRFRDDLYYRLRVAPIALPPLRDRREDILLLAEHFIANLRRKTSRPIEGLAPEAEAVLLDHSWPGNVRELENAIEFAFVKARRGRIGLDHLPPEVRESEGVGGPSLPGAEPGREPILDRRTALSPDGIATALSWANGNIAKAARRLDISRTTLYKKMREFRLPRRPT